MTITVDPATFVITVLKSEMTLVQSVPTVIYDLPLNDFRLALKDWEDDVNGGIPFLKTHTHNTEVSLGGLTYARVIEILAPYTITFEDDAYAVNLVGANSNVGDRVNVNQVSVRSANSAGLISTPLIEFSSFEGGVWWDPTNTTTKAVSGSIFPAGTRLTPCLSLTDVRLIASTRGLNVVYVMGNGTINTGLDFSRYVFEGQTHVNNIATVDPSANVTNAVFRDLTITGTLDGGNEIKNCIVDNIAYVNGHIHNSGLTGNMSLAGTADAILVDCYTIDPYNPPIIDCGGSGQNLIIPNYAGIITIKNITGANVFIGIGLNAGTVILDSTTITNGTIHVSGSGEVVDENNTSIYDGLWNGVTIINKTTNPEHTAKHVWDKNITTDHTTADTAGEKINKIDRDVGDAQGLILSS